jgi:sulfate adenylyltransferase
VGVNKAPHGGVLRDLYLAGEAIADAKARARSLPGWNLTPRQCCDIELILNGAFSPLSGFMVASDYQSVVESMRLADSVLWPIPVTLDVTEEFAASLDVGAELALHDPEGVLVAILHVDDIFRPDRSAEAHAVYGTAETTHPGVRYLLDETHPVYVGGTLEGVERPPHYDFLHLRDSPLEMRARFEKLGWRRVVAFHTSRPMHAVHYELTIRAVREAEANLLIHPTVGVPPTMRTEYYSRVRCYEKLQQRYPEPTTMLRLLPLATRLAGPREAVWHALVRQNFGCTHFVVGSHHANPSLGEAGRCYSDDDTFELVDSLADELDITIVPMRQLVYVEDRASFMLRNEVPDEMRVLDLSERELIRRFDEGLDVPEWFSFPEVIEELERSYPPRSNQGFTVFLTGLSGSGKSTIANALVGKLKELTNRRVTLLDGDIVRKHLSSELGFSKEHRNLNISRIGFVASEITKNGGIAICAPIAPYSAVRREVRKMIEPVGGFVEVHVATPIDVCEARDRKGLYAKARAGKLKGFTGIDDPYEAPEFPEVSIDTSELSADLAAHRILIKLENMGLIR